MNLSRQGLEIGPINILGLHIHPFLHFYGLIIVLGIMAAAYLASRMAKLDEKDPDHVWNGLLWVVIAGVIGARLWSITFPAVSSVEAGRNAHWYWTHLFDFHEGPFIIWSGGLSVFGAVIGGAVGILLYAYKNKLDILSWIDIGAVVAPLGQAIGRWGNYVNQELYGKPTDLPWGIRIDNAPLKYSSTTHFHPLFLYESMWNLLVVCVLLLVWLRYRDRLKKGDFLLLYLILYPAARFFLEYLRIDVTKSGGINVSQAFSAIVVILAAASLAIRHRDVLLRRLSRQKGTPAAE